MSYINVGARVAGNTKPTKKALKDALKSDPTTVTFYTTDAFGPWYSKTFRGDDIPAGFKLSVVGPDPYRERTWYATVEPNRAGEWVAK